MIAYAGSAGPARAGDGLCRFSAMAERWLHSPSVEEVDHIETQQRSRVYD
jgi:hypothetical protein